MPTLRQLVIGALLLALAIAVVAGVALRNAAQPLGRADAQRAESQLFSIDMGLSAGLPEQQLR